MIPIPHYSKWKLGDVYFIEPNDVRHHRYYGFRIITHVLELTVNELFINTNLGERIITDTTMERITYHSSTCTLLKLVFSI